MTLDRSLIAEKCKNYGIIRRKFSVKSRIKQVRVVYFNTMQSHRLIYLMSFFDVYGFNTGATKFSSNKKICIFINCAHICLAALFIWCQVYLAIAYYAELRMIVFLNQILQYSLALYTYLFVIFDSICQRKRHSRFWEIVRSINSDAKQNKFSCFCFVLKLSIFLGASTFCWILNCVFYKLLLDPVLLAYFLLMKICHVRTFYYIFCVEILLFQMKTVNYQLREMTMELSPTNRAQRLRLIREHWNSIHDMITLMDDVFGCSNVVIILFCFFFLLTDLNWVYTYPALFLSIPSTFHYICSTTNNCEWHKNNLFVFFEASFIWMFLDPLLIFYLFFATTQCLVMVTNKNHQYTIFSKN